MVCATSVVAGRGGYSITRVRPRFTWFRCKAIWVGRCWLNMAMIRMTR